LALLGPALGRHAPDLRAYRALRDAGATWAEIARETSHDWRTVKKKYLSPDACDRPLAVTTRGPTKKKLIDPYTDLIAAWLKSARRLQATTIHQRLVADHGFAGSCQRVKLYLPAGEALRGRAPAAAVARAP
jgi:hypothetical protein